jgi:hypothetical protein
MNFPGWSPNKPTVHISSARDRIDAQVGQIEYSIFVESLSYGLMPFLNHFGKLYHGYLNPIEFKKRWKIEWLILMRALNEIGPQTIIDWEIYNYKSVAFYFMMLRIAVSQPWNWPAFLYRSPNNPIGGYETGKSRLITTGLCRPDPWNHYRVLFQELPNYTPDDVLINYTSIDTDEDLHQLFNLKFDRNTVVGPAINFNFIMEEVEKHPRVRLRSINDNPDNELTDTAKKLMFDFVEWRKIYGFRPKLYVYTNNPELITDQSSSWEIVYVDNPHGEKVVETMLYHYVQSSNPLHEKNHVLYHYTQRRIDVGDFLPWMGTTYSSYIGPDWSFALLRPDTYYKSIQMDLSYIH